MENSGGQRIISKLRISGIKLSLTDNEDILRKKAALAMGIELNDIVECSIYKKSLDARKDELHFVYILDLIIKEGKKIKSKGRDISITAKPVSAPYIPKMGNNTLDLPPLVVGAGPAGLFAALFLARHGYRPCLIEQGKDVDQRLIDVNRFWLEGLLDPASNVQFGEGGAGTFSDGKLTSRSKDPLAALVLGELVEAGAKPEILYWHKPHIGSDVLIKIIKNLRQKIIALGGNVVFDARLEELNLKKASVFSVKIAGIDEPIVTNTVVLAPGNSSRHTYRMLIDKGIAVVVKPFAIGVRIEHEQSYIDKLQYGKFCGQPSLGAADYRLTWRDQIGDRGVYTFCMCPGGKIINAASEAGGLATNGISYSLRDSGKANSAVVATVNSNDFGTDPLAALEWQKKWERLAYLAGGGDNALPCQMALDFINNRTGEITAEGFSPLAKGINRADLRSCLPLPVSESIGAALLSWHRQMDGFLNNAVLAGVETRTSAPLRILRGENMQSQNCDGLYPIGEGSGYAGGIVSSAIDGIKAAYAIISKYAKPKNDFQSNLWQIQKSRGSEEK